MLVDSSLYSTSVRHANEMPVKSTQPSMCYGDSCIDGQITFRKSPCVVRYSSVENLRYIIFHLKVTQCCKYRDSMGVAMGGRNKKYIQFWWGTCLKARSKGENSTDVNLIKICFGSE
jgi:hypothetical protein